MAVTGDRPVIKGQVLGLPFFRRYLNVRPLLKIDSAKLRFGTQSSEISTASE